MRDNEHYCRSGIRNSRYYVVQSENMKSKVPVIRTCAFFFTVFLYDHVGNARAEIII